MTQKERQERSRREIFQAALEEFGAQGYDSVTMDGICSRHGISKGMMYHYYANKDELFLLCVQDAFQALLAQIQKEAAELEGQSAIDRIKNYFLIRERFFQAHPKQKMIFESAMLRPPRQLVEQIQALRAPIREMNRQFMSQVTAQMTLRPGLDREKVTRYLEGLESHFWSLAAQYQPEHSSQDLHSMLEVAEDLLDVVLFGVLPPPAGETQAQAKAEDAASQ